jgi:DNA-binding response OmpR family regulator
MGARILLVSGSQGVIESLSAVLAVDSAEIEVATDRRSAYGRASTEPFDVIVIDTMLPDGPGLGLCADFRKTGIDTSIVLLTEERVNGLRTGADDCVSRSCDRHELQARVEALLRRVHKPGRPTPPMLQVGDVIVDFQAAEARKGDQVVRMSGKELRLLQYLAAHRERVVSRREVLRDVWECDSPMMSRTIDVHIGWLRQKLEDDPQSPRFIKTIRGRGYRLDC